MRIALVDESRRHARGRESVASLSARPVEQLAVDLAVVGHVVSHLRLRRASLRAVEGRSATSQPAAVSSMTGPLDVAPGRELSVLRAVAPDAVLGVGEGPGRVLEELSRGLPTPWVWAPSVGSGRFVPGASEWWPTTAARIVLPTDNDRDAVVRAGVSGSRCDVVPWSLAPQLVQTPTPDALQTVLGAAGILVTVPQGAMERELIVTAMWSGVPVVASESLDAHEFIETGCTGLVLPSGDTRRLARAMSVVCRDGSGRVQWARAARRRASERFDPSVTARALAAVLGEREEERVGVGHPGTTRAGRRATAGNAGGAAAS